MNWYLQSGKDSDVAISTRVRLARNLDEFKFNLKDKKSIDKMNEKMKELSWNIGYDLKFFKLEDVDDITKMSLVEKNLISPEFALDKLDVGSILINEDENICIMINEEDHLRIQVFSSGLDIENTLNLAKELDEKIGGILNYAIDKDYGYLTSCPTNVGTGLRVSVMLHLPALRKTKNIQNVLDAITNFGVNIRGIYGENSKSSSDMFQISNKQTLGITEEDIAKNIKIITEKIIDQERKARKFLIKDNIELEDKVYRSFGILKNCRKISSNEARELLSIVKLGTDLGILDEMTDLKVLKLYLYTKPANLQKYLKGQYENLERDIKRAEIIKQIIEEK